MPATDNTILRTVLRRIGEGAESHVPNLAKLGPQPPGETAISEKALLRDIDVYVNRVLKDFDNLAAPAAYSGAYQELIKLYTDVQEAATASEEDAPALEGSFTLDVQEQWLIHVKGLLAAETEVHGKFQVRRNDSTRLATMLELIGAGFRTTGLPLHAARAYEQAADQHRLLRDQRAQDMCMLRATRARHAAERSGVRKILAACGDALVGYGYLPFRLLGWVLVQLALFSVLLWTMTPPEIGAIQATHLCLVNYLNPLGIGDIGPLKGPGRSLLVVESYAGTVSTSVFFALLVRRWFNA